MRLTIALVHIIAVNIEVTIPTDRVIAKPFTGPVPIKYKINAVIKVVTLASKIVTNALEKPSRIAVCGSLFFNSSLLVENIKLLYLGKTLENNTLINSLNYTEKSFIVLFITKKKAISSIESDYNLFNPNFLIQVII